MDNRKYSNDEILSATDIVVNCILNGLYNDFDLTSVQNTEYLTSLQYMLKMLHGREVKLNLNGSEVIVDRGISQSVNHLNTIGLKTIFSCSGHYIQEPYIMVQGIIKLDLESIKLEYGILRDFTVIRGSLGFDDLDSLDKLVDYNCKIMSLDKNSYTLGLCNSSLSDYNKVELDVISYISGSNIFPNISRYIDRVKFDLTDRKEILLKQFPDGEERIKTLLSYTNNSEQKMNIF